jgi:hypothetical protein
MFDQWNNEFQAGFARSMQSPKPEDDKPFMLFDGLDSGKGDHQG